MRMLLGQLTATVCLILTCIPCLAAEQAARNLAANVIHAEDAGRHVDKLADDTFEGREAGSRGGRAAGIYLVNLMKQCGLKPSNKDSYYQKFDAGYANLLGVVEGTDPQLKQQYIIVSGHYDHVGYGSRSNSYGPIGQIHNGADDNASGVSGLLEVIKAFQALSAPPKRSVLFAFWDGEEKGLLGSKHWLSNPTVPVKQVRLMINVDMIGRMRNNKMEVWGTRSSAGLRRLVSLQNDESGPAIDFGWEMKDNSDHWTFFSRKIPVLMLHTGLHDDYHRPSDDAHRVNDDGIRKVARLMFKIADEAASSDTLSGFRTASTSEISAMRSMLEAPLPALPSRLGVRWDETEEGAIRVNSVTVGSPAARAGLKVGDVISSIDGAVPKGTRHFQYLVLSATRQSKFAVLRNEEQEPLEISVELAGRPTRLGIAWRFDNAEPGSVILSRVVPGSPAAYAGLRVGDRVYRIAGQDFKDGDAFGNISTGLTGTFELQVEREGRVRTVNVELPEDIRSDEPSTEL